MLAVYTAEASDKCRRTYVESGLTPEQRSALVAAKRTHSIEVLKNKNGQVVVFLGEGKTKESESSGAPGDLNFLFTKETGHHQDRAGKDSGQAMLDAFPVRFLEGFPGGMMWRAYISLAHFLEGLGHGRVSESTIAQARKLARKQSGDPEVKTLNLEDGLNPTGTELAAAWAYPSLMLGPKITATLGVLGTLATLDATNFETSMWTVAGASLAWSAALFGKMIYLPELGQYLRTRRDTVMADNLLKYLNENPEGKAVLVIVGQNHIYGIRERLRREGYEWTSVKDLEADPTLVGN